MRLKGEQESFWEGDFGTDYTARHETEDTNNMAFWNSILFNSPFRFYDIISIMELGANRGSNIKCLKKIYPAAEIGAVEINRFACDKVREIPGVELFEGSIFDLCTKKKWDMVITKGLLIHIDPILLDKAYELIYDLSAKYILLAEYYNPKPVEVPYRGNRNKLFKRDFAGDMIDRYNLELLEYGFRYHRDEYPQDDLTWFLMEKRA